MEISCTPGIRRGSSCHTYQLSINAGRLYHFDQRYYHLKENLRAYAKDNPVISRTAVLEIIEDAIKRQNDWYVINEEPLLQNRSIASMIYIGSNTSLPPIRLKGQTILFVHQKNKICRQEVPYLRILDFLVLRQKDRNTDLEWLIMFLLDKIDGMTHEERKIMASLARKYKPFTRAILALTLKNTGELKLFSKIIQTISPLILKKYKLVTSFIFIFFIPAVNSYSLFHMFAEICQKCRGA